MPSQEALLIETARRVQAFLDAHATVIGGAIAGTRAGLDQAVSQLDAMAVTQAAGQIETKGTTLRQRALRATLRAAFMKPIADIAKLKLGTVPEAGARTMPKKSFGATHLVAAAHAMADAAQAHQAVFTEFGLTPDFINQLRAAADAVTASIDGRKVHVGLSGGVTASIKDQSNRVRGMLTLINILVVPRLAHDIPLLAQWHTARTIAPRHHQVPVAGPAPTVAPAANPSPSTPAPATAA